MDLFQNFEKLFDTIKETILNKNATGTNFAKLETCIVGGEGVK